MSPDELNLDQRLSRFEAQLDRFSLALHQWQQQARILPSSSAAPDVDQRIRTIEETLDRETAALRRLHEEPLRELQAHVAALKEICVAAATSVLSCDLGTAHVYGEVKDELRLKGRPIPENDVWIAAVARQHGLMLVTRDEHFQHVNGLGVEGWTTMP